MKRYRRLPRIDLPNATYFASVTTAGSRSWFAQPRHAAMLSRLICAERGRSALLHGFVVMPNHYHVLLTLLGEHRIHEVIQRINSLSARRVNRLEGRRGRLWARRFHDHVVRNQDDFDECLQYIHENPRVGGLAEVSCAYPYSSAGCWEEAKSGGANSIRPEDPMAGASSLRLPSAQACRTEGHRPSCALRVPRVVVALRKAGPTIQLLEQDKASGRSGSRENSM